MSIGKLTLPVVELDEYEHVKFGVGVIFANWPEEKDMLEIMVQMRAALKEKSPTGNIYWHLSKDDNGWNFSGNVALADSGVTVPTG